MKISLVAPGEINIPPSGWGALETVVWNQKSALEKLGHSVDIVNDNDINDTYKHIQSNNPDIVHLHYGKHYEILPHINCRKIITNHDGSFLNSIKFHENIIRQFMYDCEFFILTTWEQNLLRRIGFNNRCIKILPNGVSCNSFRFTNNPAYKNSSLCIGKIDQRKRQSYLQQLNADIYFIGQNTDPKFNPLDPMYLGPMSRDQIFNGITEYCNLILLSETELQPLVCLEALSAGLGLVLSEACIQNLDTSLPFITVIKSTDINNPILVKEKILENRHYCNSIDRSTIRSYAETFSWEKIIAKYNSYIS